MLIQARRFLSLAFVLATAGCHSTAVEVVRSLASTDLPCPEKKVEVRPAGPKGTYRAEGCGKNARYVCEGWDSYNQAPLCEPSK